jgi:hypothetical protein
MDFILYYFYYYWFFFKFDSFFFILGLFCFSCCLYFYWTGPMPLTMAYIPNFFKWKLYFHKWHWWVYPQVTWNLLSENYIFVDIDFRASFFKVKYPLDSTIWLQFKHWFIVDCMHSIKMFHLGFNHFYYDINDWFFDTFTFWIHYKLYIFYFFSII